MNRSAVLRIAAAPMIAMVVLSMIWEVTTLVEYRSAAWTLYFLQVIAAAWLAVSVHRLVLLSAGEAPQRLDAHGLRRVGKFVGLLICTWLMFQALQLFMYQATRRSTSLIFSDQGLPVVSMAVVYLSPLAFVALCWLVARISLLFPAIALDWEFDPAAAWKKSRGNGWKLLVITFVLPFVFSLLENQVTRYEATRVEYALLAVLSAVFLIVEVVALSLSFRVLTAPAPPPTDPPA